MENIFIFAVIISVIYFGVKLIEMKFVEKEPKPLKILVRDAILVYFSVVVSYFLMDQISPFTQSGGTIVSSGSNTTPVFTDNPEF
jgi:hypothetical protein